MNIAIDIRPLMTPYRTGVGEYTYELLHALFAIDNINQYVLFYNAYGQVDQYLPAWQQKNVHFVRMKWPNKILNASLTLLGRPAMDQKIIRNLKLDIRNFDWWFSPNLNFTALSPRTKHILTIHDLSFEFFPGCFSSKDRLWHKLVSPRRQCERADIILAPSEHTKRDVIEKYGIHEKKIKVLYPGFRMSDVRPCLLAGRCQMSDVKNKYHLPERYILFLGAIEPRKNVLAVIEAYKQSSLFTDHCSLIIAGPLGYKSSEVLERVKTTPGCEYIGYVASEDKSALYAGTSLFVYPSLYEGFGLPVLEAMAMGIPVITSHRGSLPEVAGSAAWYVNPLNCHEIASAMRALADNSRLRRVHTERGVLQSQQFSYARSAEQFLSLLS